jgi:tetratricopeptide (TPR) repeat protein
LCEVHRHAGRFEVALGLLARVLPDKTGLHRMNLLWMRGRLRSHVDPELARADLSEALAIAGALGQPEVTPISIALAVSLGLIGDFEGMQRQLEAIHCGGRRDHVDGLLSWTLVARGDTARAMDVARRSVAVARADGHDTTYSLKNLAEVGVWSGAWDEAAAAATEAVSQAELGGSAMARAMTLGCYGECLGASGRWTEAERALGQALRSATADGAHVELARISLTLAMVWIVQGRWTEARAYLDDPAVYEQADRIHGLGLFRTVLVAASSLAARRPGAARDALAPILAKNDSYTAVARVFHAIVTDAERSPVDLPPDLARNAIVDELLALRRAAAAALPLPTVRSLLAQAVRRSLLDGLGAPRGRMPP